QLLAQPPILRLERRDALVRRGDRASRTLRGLLGLAPRGAARPRRLRLHARLPLALLRLRHSHLLAPSAELHVERLRPLLAPARLGHHLVALAQILELCARPQLRAVEEHVLRPLVRSDEAEPLVAHDTLDGAGHRARLYARRVLLASCAHHFLENSEPVPTPPAGRGGGRGARRRGPRRPAACRRDAPAGAARVAEGRGSAGGAPALVTLHVDAQKTPPRFAGLSLPSALARR